ncbi:MAG TPA: hypothetical protein VF895_00790 [Gaiellaceae bacterium]
MSTVLSLLGVAVFIVCTISVAAAVTWSVVRLSPPKARQKTGESSS